MRKIIFRGQRADNNEWVYGYFVKTPKGECRIYWQPFDTASQNTYHVVQEKTVGQFTGLKDKNGVEIYHKDLVKNRDYIFEVKYNTQQGKWWLNPIKHIGNEKEEWFITALENQQLGNGYYSRKDLKVIGNIHENK